VISARLAEGVTYIGDLVEKGRALEAKGREIAVRRNELISDEDLKWTWGMYEWHFDLYDRVKVIAAGGYAISSAEYNTLSLVCKHGKRLADYAADTAKAGLGMRERGTPLFKVSYAFFYDILDELREYCANQQKLTGRSVTLLVDYMHPGDYSWSNLARDFTSCFSPFLNWVSEKLGSIVEVYPDTAFATTRSLPVAVECARNWASAVRHYDGLKLIWSFDYSYKFCFVDENRAVFRLGAREDHRARAEFTLLLARVEHILLESPGVHAVFARLSQHYGCRVLEQTDRHVVVEIPRSAFRDFFRGVLALAVSMRMRISEPKDYWGRSPLLREEWKKLAEQGLDPVELEFRLCLKAYELLKEIAGA
jgi:hypothetical protein